MKVVIDDIRYFWNTHPDIRGYLLWVPLIVVGGIVADFLISYERLKWLAYKRKPSKGGG